MNVDPSILESPRVTTEEVPDQTPKKKPERVPIVFAFECPPCDCCEEPYCKLHNMHLADCDCIGPDNASELGYRLVVEDRKMWGYKD